MLGYAGHIKKTRELLWLCQCRCGDRTVYKSGRLREGCSMKRGLSCGCYLASRKHGLSDSPTMNTYYAMLKRCYRPKARSYADYGARGITVCDRWRGPQGFQNFVADMGIRPRGKTIDRKDVNGNYTPDNCRWATPKAQANNRRPRAIAIPTTNGAQTEAAAITGKEDFF